MAEIPIFEGSPGGAEATVRTSRIGPEDPKPAGLEALGRAGKELGTMFEGISRQQQRNMSEDAKSQMMQQDWDNSQSMAKYNYKDPNDYMAQAKTLADYSTVRDSLVKQGATHGTLAAFDAQASGRKIQFMKGQMVAIGSRYAQDTMAQVPQILQTKADAYANAPTDAAREVVRADGENFIKDLMKVNSTTGKPILHAGEGYALLKGMNNRFAVSIMTKEANDPDQQQHLIQMVTSGDYLKHPDMKYATPGQAREAASLATKGIKETMNRGEKWVSDQGKTALNNLLDADSNGTMTHAMLEEQVKLHPKEINAFYRMKTGQKPPGEESDQGALAAYNNALANAKTKAQRDGIMARALNDPNIVSRSHSGLSAAKAMYDEQETETSKQNKASGETATTQAIRRKLVENKWVRPMPGLPDMDMTGGMAVFGGAKKAAMKEIDDRRAEINAAGSDPKAYEEFTKPGGVIDGIIDKHLPPFGGGGKEAPKPETP